MDEAAHPTVAVALATPTDACAVAADIGGREHAEPTVGPRGRVEQNVRALELGPGRTAGPTIYLEEGNAAGMFYAKPPAGLSIPRAATALAEKGVSDVASQEARDAGLEPATPLPLLIANRHPTEGPTFRPPSRTNLAEAQHIHTHLAK